MISYLFSGEKRTLRKKQKYPRNTAVGTQDAMEKKKGGRHGGVHLQCQEWVLAAVRCLLLEKKGMGAEALWTSKMAERYFSSAWAS